MKQHSIIWCISVVAWLLVSSLSCDRGDRVWNLSYKVQVLTGNGTYSVKYLDGNGVDVQEGNLSGDWSSGTYSQVETGQATRLQVLPVNGTMTFRLEIIRDGAVHESGESIAGELDYMISAVL